MSFTDIPPRRWGRQFYVTFQIIIVKMCVLSPSCRCAAVTFSLCAYIDWECTTLRVYPSMGLAVCCTICLLLRLQHFNLHYFRIVWRLVNIKGLWHIISTSNKNGRSLQEFCFYYEFVYIHFTKVFYIQCCSLRRCGHSWWDHFKSMHFSWHLAGVLVIQRRKTQ